MASKTIARRKTTEEEIAPQSQILYGKSPDIPMTFSADDIAHADGTISTLVAVKPARFKRLQLASEQLVRNAQHIAGLTPRAFRTVRNEIINKPLARGVLDGHLLAQFAQQPIKRQKEMMRQIGSSSTTVFSDLHSLSGFC
jgi:cleavage and polyadenylation specificity factor subunit 1